MPSTLFEKIWKSHLVIQGDVHPDLVYVDRIFLHERTGSFALKSLKERGLKVKNPKHVFATMLSSWRVLSGFALDTLERPTSDSRASSGFGWAAPPPPTPPPPPPTPPHPPPKNGKKLKTYKRIANREIK